MDCRNKLWRDGFFIGTALLCLLHFAIAGQAQTSDLDQRLAKLKDPDRMVRMRAAYDLHIWSTDPRAIEPLMEILGDPDLQTQHEAGGALAAIGEPAFAPLVAALSDPDPDLRKGALMALSGFNTPEAVKAIAGALQDPDRRVRWRAIAALGRSKNASAVEPLIALLLADSKDGTVIDASLALTAMGGPAIGPLEDLLKSGNQKVRRRALEALCPMHEPRAIDALIGVLNSQDVHQEIDLRIRAAMALSEKSNPDPRAIEPLTGLLKNPQASVRLRVIGLLGWFKDPRTIEPLAGALEDTDASVRLAAAEALGERGDARAVGPLLEALKSSSSDDVRSRAARGLGGSRESRVVEPLISALNDPSLGVQREAAEALGTIKDERAVEPLIAAFGRTLRASESTPGTVDSNPAKARENRDLQLGLQFLREAEVGALAKIGDPRAIPSLVAALKEVGFQTTAIEGLGETRDPRAVAPLIELLRQPRAYFMETDEALGKIGKPAVRPLLAALKDKDAGVRERMAGALAAIGDRRTFKPLLPLIRDSNPEVRSTAAWALGQTKDRRAIRPLISLFKDSGPVPNAAANTLASFGPSAVEPLIACLKSPDPDIRRNAGQALGSMQDPRAVNALKEALQRHDAEVIAGAYLFFVRRGYPGSEDALIEALNGAGDKAMARVFVQSGNGRLMQAARLWPQRESRQERPGYSGVRWGTVPL